MFKILARYVPPLFILLPVVAGTLLPAGARAEPIKLKLSFYSSDRSPAYLSAVKPFVDAVNDAGKDLLQIEVYFSGALSKVQADQPQLVLDGAADIAFIVVGQNAERFSDSTAIELPGLFRDTREATLVHTRLVAANVFAGYDNFFVIGAYASQPAIIHSRKPMATLADLKGQKLRTNNAGEAAALEKLGALPRVLALNQTAQAISSGTVDGATASPSALFDAGIARLVSNHYFLPTSTAPLALIMNRNVFDGLPAPAKGLIQKYSGEWAAARYIEMFDASNNAALQQIKLDTRRKAVIPSPADLATAEVVFKAVKAEWVAKIPRNRELLKSVETGIATLRAAR